MKKFVAAIVVAGSLACAASATAAVTLPTAPYSKGIKLSAIAYDGEAVIFEGGPFGKGSMFTIANWSRSTVVTTLTIRGAANQTVYNDHIGQIVIGQTDADGLFSLASPWTPSSWNVLKVGNPANRTTSGFEVLEFRAEAIGARVPEPSTWAMMIVGFGAVGTAVRRRRSVRLA